MPRGFENWFEKKTPNEGGSETNPNYGITESGKGRPLEAYIKEFNINLEELRGKKVLDLGAGLENRFAEELREKIPEAKVFSLSPDFSNHQITSQTRHASPEGNLVAGTGQQLPFTDESFDRIYALHVWEHIKTKDDFQSALKEMARTLKKGGTAKMGPLYDVPNHSNYFKEFSDDEDIQSMLARYDIILEKEEVSPELPPVKVKDDMANAFYVRGYSLVLRKPVENQKIP